MKQSLPVTLSIAAFLLGGSAAAQAPEEAPVASNPGPARVSIAPLRIEMEGPQRAETLRVINPSARAIGVQVRAFAWSQENGEDVYSPTADLQITPSIIMIEPGDTQIFRVLRRELPPEGERRYRIAVDQLPDPELQRNGQATARIRFTLPMFTDRNLAAPAVLDWSIEGDTLRVANSGQQTARMVNLALVDAAGRPIAVEGAGLHYIMGEKSLSWTLPGGCPTGPARLSVSVDGETVDAQVAPNCS